LILMWLFWYLYCPRAVGGSTLYIESTHKQHVDPEAKDGQGTLSLTGQLGDVMKESAQIAYTYAKTLLMEKDPDNKNLQRGHIHVHVPEVGGCLMLIILITNTNSNWSFSLIIPIIVNQLTEEFTILKIHQLSYKFKLIFFLKLANYC